jgi:DnaA-homolog protein
MSDQLSLNLRLRDGSSFDNYLSAGNREIVDRLRAAVTPIESDGAVGERVFFLWGDRGTGKTHLLQAACRLAQEVGCTPFYIPLAEAGELVPAILENAEQAPLVCLDDVERIAGNDAWELALFNLCEQQRMAGGALVAAAKAGPAHLGLSRPELATRLAWGPVYQLHGLSDMEKIEAIQLRGHNRGLDITDEVARYILHRYPRQMSALFDLLERLDRVSLASQRRITIPFIRELEEREVLRSRE